MKNVLLVLGLFCFLVSPSFGAMAVSSASPETTVKDISKETKAEWKKLSKKERRVKKKEMRKQIKTLIKKWKEGSDSDLILLVVIAILIPPLAMGLYDGLSGRFWLSLLLTLLFYVPGLIYTLIVLLSEH